MEENINVIQEKAVLESEEVFYEENNKKYRFLLTKAVKSVDGKEIKEKKVTVIMYNPSLAGILSYDKTTMNIENFLINKGFNKITLANLFPIMKTKSNGIEKIDSKFINKNKEYLKNAIENSDTLILAWGYGKENKNNTVKEMIKYVEDIAKKYKTSKEIKCLKDGKGNIKCHPQNMNINKWKLCNYPF